MNKIKLYFLILLGGVVLLGAGCMGRYFPWTKVDDSVLVSKNWNIEGNGAYNRIVLDADNTFKTYEYPKENGVGKWEYKDGKLNLKFDQEVNNGERVYNDLKFDRRGILHLSTDGNEEKWTGEKR